MLVAPLLFLALTTVSTTCAQESLPIETRDAEIAKFFQSFESATQEETAKHLISLFDFTLLIDAVIEESGVEIPGPLRRQLIGQTAIMTRRQIELLGEKWTRHKVVQILWTDDHRIAEVFVRNWSDDFSTSRTIYYLQNTAQGWRVYDWMDLSLGLSTVSVTAAILRDGSEANFPPQFAKGVRSLFRVIMAAAQGDLDKASEWARKSTGLTIPPMLEALRWNLFAAIEVELDPVLALEYLDKAEAFDEGMAVVSYLRCSAHLLLENYDQVVRHAQDYLRRFGADADTFYAMGIALDQLGETEEAIEAYKAGLSDTPESIDIVAELAHVLPKDRKSEFVPYFKALPDPLSHFELLADNLEAYEDGPGLQALIEAASTISTDLPHLEYYQLVLMVIDERHEDAYAKLIDLAKEFNDEPDYRPYYDALLCQMGAELGKSVEAYQACENKSDALDSLIFALESKGADEIETDAEPTKNTEVEKQIETLLALHAKQFADAPATWIMIAERDWEAQRFEKALQGFYKAFEMADSPEEQQTVSSQITTCSIDFGKPIQAYEKLEDKKHVFRLLTDALDPESADYIAIKKLHREKFPNDLIIAVAEVESNYESEKFAAALKLADAALADAANDDTSSWRLESIQFYRILCLAQLKRTDEALIAARAVDSDSRDELRALIYAIKGRRQRFVEAYQRCVLANQWFAPEDILAYVKVPKEWFPEPSKSRVSEFYGYSQVRRIVFLLSDPIQINRFTIGNSSSAAGMRLFETEKADLSTSNTEFLCALSENAVVVATDQCKYFLSVDSQPYLSNHADLQFTGDGTDQHDETLQKAVEDHRAWFAIDIYVWPQDLEHDFPVSIPKTAVERLVKLATGTLGGRAALAIHPDSSRAVRCDQKFFDRLLSDRPISAFETAEN